LVAIMGFFFLVVCSVGVLRPIKNSLALDGLGATDFYKVYMVSALAILIVPPYNRLAERHSPRWLIPGAALFFASNLLLFRAFYREGSAAYGMLFYGWYDLFAAALVTQFFMATQHFFNARSAKRVYPLIVAGGAVGATLGGTITGLFAERLGTPNLLLVAATLIVAFGVGLPLVWAAEPATPLNAGVRRVEQLTAAGLRSIFANPQVRMIALGVLVTVVVKQLVDYQFNVITKEVYVTRDAVSAFQGKFNAATQWLPIVVVLALRPLMQRWGVGLAVFLLPAFMLVTTFGIAVWWSLATIIAAKAAETSLRYSAERTGREILYVPVPEEIKLQAKAYIDVAVEKGLGKLVSAGVIFLLLTFGGTRAVAWAAFALSALWVAAAMGVRREYVRTLAGSIRGRVASLRGLSASLTDASTLPVVQQALTGSDTLQTAFVLDLIDQADPSEVGPFSAELHGLLQSPTAEVRERALLSLIRYPDAIDPVRVRERLTDPAAPVREAAVRALCVARPTERGSLLVELLGSPAPGLRTAALERLLRGDFGSHGAEAIGHAYLHDRADAARAGAREARREVALVAGIFRADPNIVQLLESLLADPDPEIASAALRSAGLLRDPQLYPRLIAALRDPRTRESARESLAGQGAAAVPALSDALLDPAADPAVRRVIPSVLARIPTQESVDFLFRSLLARETEQLLDYRSLKALSKLRARHPRLRFDPEVVRVALDREVECARRYRAAERFLESRAGSGSRAQLLRQALLEARRERREGAFRCLGLAHDPDAMYRCYLAISGGRPGPCANALEWLEQTVGHALFTSLGPILGEGRGAEIPSPSADRLVVELHGDEDSWVAQCVAAAAGELGLIISAHALPLVSPLRLTPSHSAPARAAEEGSRVDAPGVAAQRESVSLTLATSMDLIEKVFLLQGVDLLHGARSAHLALLASIAEEVEANAGTMLLRRDEPTDALYLVIHGSVELQGLGGQSLVVRNGTAFGTWALIDEAPSLVDALTLEHTHLLRIVRIDFFDLLADHPELSVGLLQGLARRVRTLVS
jgi:ATP:ADP antiporter, AAA family